MQNKPNVHTHPAVRSRSEVADGSPMSDDVGGRPGPWPVLGPDHRPTPERIEPMPEDYGHSHCMPTDPDVARGLRHIISTEATSIQPESKASPL